MKPVWRCIVTTLCGLFAALFWVSAYPAGAAESVAKTDVADTLLSLASPVGTGQSGFGRLDPSPPVGITPDQIVKTFSERGTEFAKVRDSYTYTETVKVDTISDDTNKVDGEYKQVTDITFDENGKRQEHVVFAPQNTLERIMMTPADFKDIEHRLPFILTTGDLPQYDVTYVGKQKIDELDTYVFDAEPKVIEKNHRYFKGRVWVDQQDLEIVLVNGKNVPDDTRPGHEDLSPPFTTYYQQIDGKYWFPVYTKAEGNLHFAAQHGALSQDVHIRSTVTYTGYKSFRAKSTIIYNGEALPSPPPQPAPPPK